MGDMKPVRLRLSRQKGFDLQALSRAANGLEAVKVARPGVFGNPFTVQGMADAHDCRPESAHRYAVDAFREWLALPNDHETFGEMYENEWTQKQHAEIHRRLPELRGKNLACFCKAEHACHADVLLEIANAPDAGRRALADAEPPHDGGGEQKEVGHGEG